MTDKEVRVELVITGVEDRDEDLWKACVLVSDEPEDTYDWFMGEPPRDPKTGLQDMEGWIRWREHNRKMGRRLFDLFERTGGDLDMISESEGVEIDCGDCGGLRAMLSEWVERWRRYRALGGACRAVTTDGVGGA
jgi:hypothetical protein